MRGAQTKRDTTHFSRSHPRPPAPMQSTLESLRRNCIVCKWHRVSDKLKSVTWRKNSSKKAFGAGLRTPTGEPDCYAPHRSLCVANGLQHDTTVLKSFRDLCVGGARRHAGAHCCVCVYW